MSIEVINAVRARRFGSANRKAVAYVLADYCDAAWSCYVGQSRLAAEAEVGERTVRRMLAEFEAEGIIRREARYGGFQGRTSDRIYLIRGAIEELPATMAASADLPANPSDLPATGDTLPANGDTSTGHSLAGEPLVEPLDDPLDVQPFEIEHPSFNGRNLYRYHADLIGFPSTPGQERTIDKYLGLVGGDYWAVAAAMTAVPNPRRPGWLGEVGDLLRAAMDSRQAVAA